MPKIEAAIRDPDAYVTVSEERILARVFQHPLSHNLSWRDALALLHGIGTVEHGHDGDAVLTIGAEHLTIRPAHNKDLAADEVMALRHFLVRAGWEPDAEPIPTPAATESDLVIVIDHAEARLYALASDAGTEETDRETHHLLHDIDPEQHDADREETYPADRRFFDAIAEAATGSGRIVVIGHGTGQSNEADHLTSDLAARHVGVHARIAGEIVADLPHTTVPQLLALARRTLRPEPAAAVTD